MIVEAVVRNYLEEELKLPVFLEHEKNMPEQYVMIERTGGGRVDLLNNATLAVQSIGQSMYDAAVLNERVKSAMYALPGSHGVSSCRLNSDYNFTDTETKEYRYQAVFYLTHYE